jgi:signal transduction histidine kinase
MLKVRIYLALFLSLLGMILGVVILFRGGVMTHYRQKLIDERVGVLLEIAEKVEEAPRPKRRLKRIGRNLGIEFKIVKDPRDRSSPKEILREERVVYLFPGKGTPMGIELTIDAPRHWLIVHFPRQLEDSRRRVFLGIVMLTIFGAVGAWGLGRWSLRPLEMASMAMDRIAKGDFSHRVADPIGPAANSFNEMAERLEQVIDGQRDFMAAIGHELRTPIARMKLQLAMMEDESRAASLEGDVVELEELVESLLESARLNRGGIVLNREEVDMNELFLSALAEIDIAERSVELVVGERSVFVVDRRWFRLVVRNLLSNIVRYTTEDVQIWMGAHIDKEEYVLWVADSGEGVEASLLLSLFDPFVRGEKSRNRVTGGLGLGLMLVRQVSEVHGGYVQACNSTRSDSGLEIILRIPIHT